MSHPDVVVYLEHDGKVLLVDQQGNGPQKPIRGRFDNSEILRFPTVEEVANHGIEYDAKLTIRIVFGNQVIKVIKVFTRQRKWHSIEKAVLFCSHIT